MNKAFFVMLFFAIAAFGQQQELVAIINTVDEKDSIGFSELNYLTVRLRSIAGEVLPQNRYSIMSVMSAEKNGDFFVSPEPVIKECDETSCLVDLGRKLNAGYIAQGRIGRFAGKLTINVELYNSRNGILLASFDGNSQDLAGLLSILDAKAPDMFGKMLPAATTIKAKHKSVKSRLNRPLSLCLRVGVNSSNVDETYISWRAGQDRKINTDNRFSYQAIAILDKPLSRVFHLQPGFRLIQRGAAYKDEYNEKYEISLLYFGTFFQPTLRFPLSENIAFEIYNGPYFDFRLAEKSGVSYNLYSPIDIGLTSGAGIAFGKFYIGIFYDYGLAEISEIDYFNTYNRTFGINLGYKK
jgi:hypothetical protein